MQIKIEFSNVEPLLGFDFQFRTSPDRSRTAVPESPPWVPAQPSATASRGGVFSFARFLLTFHLFGFKEERGQPRVCLSCPSERGAPELKFIVSFQAFKFYFLNVARWLVLTIPAGGRFGR